MGRSEQHLHTDSNSVNEDLKETLLYISQFKRVPRVFPVLNPDNHLRCERQ